MAKTSKIEKAIKLLEQEIKTNSQISEEAAEEDAYRFEKFVENQIADVDYEIRELYEKIKVLQSLKKSLAVSLMKVEAGDPFEAVILLNKEEPNYFASTIMKDKEFKRIVKSIYDNFG